MAEAGKKPKRGSSFTRANSVSIATRISKPQYKQFLKLVGKDKGASGKKLRALIDRFIQENT